MKRFIILAAISLVGIFASADDQTIPAPQPRYSIVQSRSSSCYRNDLWCSEGLRKAVIKETEQAAVNYCSSHFSNTTKVLDWNAACSAFFTSEMSTPVPQPPQMPDYPQSVMCRAQFDFVCE